MSFSPRHAVAFLTIFLASISAVSTLRAAAAGSIEPDLPHPILFVTQVPIPGDFATIGSTFANHRASLSSVGRGGDLYIRYPDGTLRNLTAEAGFGATGAFQGSNAIAVRDPAVHWQGDRALFSMAIGAPAEQFQVATYYWQIYEVAGLTQGEPVAITKIANQPPDYNNITPLYGSDGRILFTSDRPRGGERHLYPQHDEYESTPTNTGLWSLDPASGDLRLLEHAPSGAFTPILDSFGRVLFTRWDHLQRDQQADADELQGNVYGTFNYADESADAERIDSREEVFPEPRPVRTDLLAGTNIIGHRFNHFFPWQIRQDGTEEETLNHIGRHELHNYFDRSFDDDSNLVEFIASVSGRVNPNSILNTFQMKEDPTLAGHYFAVEAPEFQTHASGQIYRLLAPPDANPDEIVVEYVTHPATATVVPEGEPAPAEHSGHYRDPLPVADGRLIAAHTFETRKANNDGSTANPLPRYFFRLRLVAPDAGSPEGYASAAAELTPGISRTISYWNPDTLVQYSGELWEMSPVEVRSRPQPPYEVATIPAPELQVFAEENVDPAVFQEDLRQRGLALAVSRNVTSRDAGDRQQPFNLKVANSSTQTTGAGGLVYDVAYMQFFQADQIRGIGGIDSPRDGRRVLAQPMHDPSVENPPLSEAPAGSVAIADDGSMAALVPAQRAMSWQLTDLQGAAVVRERYWITFQPGEVRVCASCHGLNTANQAGQPQPLQPPLALRQLLQFWKSAQSEIFEDSFESGDFSAWTTHGGG